ncbi:tail fiber assembly protein [Yersinia alsatica]|uniref:tail fiber assembly protein n=1 Tax=Yersinia alsatica TaxID=2890317 RepID=UPI00119D0F4D|nr:tail fiber assembly protein [Yersinia alsatica]
MEQLINQDLSNNDAYENIYVVVLENKNSRGMTVVNFAAQKYLDEFTYNGPWLKILREELPDQRYIEAWQFNKAKSAIVVNPIWLQEMHVAEAERERSHRIWLIQDELTALQTDLMLGIIDDEDTARLLNLKKYVIALKKLDLSNVPAIDWPVSPDTVLTEA